MKPLALDISFSRVQHNHALANPVQLDAVASTESPLESHLGLHTPLASPTQTHKSPSNTECVAMNGVGIFTNEHQK